MSTHHNLISEVLAADEENDRDRERDLSKKKLTLTESLLALTISLACVAMIATFLVFEIEYIVHDRGISDMFMGLVLVPLVEKLAEHLTAIDEAWDNATNQALSHILGSSVQTALLNAPIAVIVGWGLATHDSTGLHTVGMNLAFRSFEAIILILAILVVGNFLRDGEFSCFSSAFFLLERCVRVRMLTRVGIGKSNYLEGALCVLVYIIVAIAAWVCYSKPPNVALTALWLIRMQYYPNEAETSGAPSTHSRRWVTN